MKYVALILSLAMTTTLFAGYHTVRTYEKRDGTVVHEHLAGNPGSGTHCHDNVCN